MSIWRWADYFCRIPSQHHVTLGEGNTPLVRSRRIGPMAGLDNLYFKVECANPTGSYKDRFAAAAISDMLAHDQSRSIGASSGNTGSAVAAYCAAAGITCELAIVANAPHDKLKQMMAYGANVYKVKGLGVSPEVSQQSMQYLAQKASQPDAQLQISAYVLSPAGMAGVQTISYELAEQAGRLGAAGLSIDHVFVQAGGGGLTLAVALGFAGLVQRGELEKSPAVHCVQPEGNNTIAGPLRDGAEKAHAVAECTSKVSGLQVPRVMDGNEVISACRACGGTGYLVTDEDTWQLQSRLAREEGIFTEPAGAVALAGALQRYQQGQINGDDVVVCLVTGFGFKDNASVDRMIADADCPAIDVEQIPEQ